MVQTPRDHRILRFDAFEVDLRTGELRRKGLAIRLQEQPFRILALLLERPGELVTREELQQKLWPEEVVVEFDQGLNNAIKKLRRAIDDSAETPRFIETLPKRGYRFIAPVEAVGDPSLAAAADPEPSIRPRSIGRTALVLAALVAMAVAVFLAGRKPPTESVLPRAVLLAVLPLENLSGDPRQEYLSDGLTEELIGQLGRLYAGRLRVIGRASAMRFRHGDQDDIGRIARQLNVAYVLRGSVRRSGERVRVTVELIRASDQTQLWTQIYDQQLRDILGLQIELAQSIAREIPIEASGPKGAVAAGRPVNPAAYEAYLKGRYFWNKFAEPAEWKALEYFQESVRLDPDFAPAQAGLSSAFGILSVFGAIPPREGQPKAGNAARRALELDATYPLAHVQLGFFQLNYLWDFAGAMKSFERAIDLDPSSSAALHGHATALVVQGRFDEALAQMKRATEVDPLWLLSGADLCAFLYFARRYDEAIVQCNETLDLDPNFPPAHYYLAQIYETTERFEDAFRNYQAIFRSSEAPAAYIDAGEAAWASGRWPAVARKWLELQFDAPKKTLVPSFYIAESYRRIGDKKATLDWLEKACEERHYEVVFLKVTPKFDFVRSDQRFERLLKRMRLAA